MSTTVPSSPMMLDSTGQAMVQKLQGIINAIGGGGGGSMPMPPEYDPELEDYNKGYYQGQYVIYEDSIYKCNTAIYVSSGNPAGAFDSSKWDEITDLFSEFFQSKPGKITSIRNTGEIFNDYYNNVADAPYSHAEGEHTQASLAAHSEGYYTNAAGGYSHAEGYEAETGSSSTGAHAEGYQTHANGNYSHTEGNHTTASSSNSHAEGSYTTASNYDAHAEGSHTTASGYQSHAEGDTTVASGNCSHAEGYHSQATNYYSVASGYYCTASGYYSRALGYYSEAQRYGAIADGYNCIASGDYSHALGYYCKTTSPYESAFGKYNQSYTTGGEYQWYSDTSTYEVNDVVKHSADPVDYNVYKCITAITTPEAWDPTHWTVIGRYYPSEESLIFSVGNGADNSSRSNAIEVFKNGSVKIKGQEALALDPPSADGTYKLRCTVSSGVVTYAWVADV